MNKTFLVAKREFLENVRTKTFWLGILLLPFILTLSIVLPGILSKTKSARKYAVYDQSGWLFEEVQTRSKIPDLEKIFLGYQEAMKSGDESAKEKYPAFLGPWVEAFPMPFADFKPEQVRGLAQGVTQTMATGGIPGLSPEQNQALATSMTEMRAQLQDWWKSLEPTEAKKYGPDLSKSRYQLIDVDLTGETPEKKLTDLVNDETLFAAIIVNDDPLDQKQTHKYISNNLTDNDLRRWFAQYANEAVRERRFEKEGVNKATVERIQAPLKFDESRIDADTGETTRVEDKDKAKQWIPVGFVYILWFAVFMTAQMLLTNTIEEKSNRTIEVLLSSVSPLQLMGGKILGIAGTGLTVILSWVLFFFVVVKFVPLLTGFEPPFDLTFLLTDKVYLASFVAYFVAGYLLLAALLVGIGSVCNSLKEAQNLMMPVSVVMIVPLMAMIPVAQDPNGPLARVLSYIPFMTPFLMMNRAAGPPSTFDYVATSILLVISIAVFFWAAAKIFRIGILMTGKPPKLREIIRWVRAPVGAVPVRKDDD